jgi:GDP/UDP-N,N'-diacetylbacillosamine 2-epimerase (hydrolysing)
MKNICVVTGTRAEYYLLKPLLNRIKNEKSLKLSLIVTGMHLSPEFGLTYKEILSDGFSIDKKVEMLLSSDSSVGVSKAIGLGLLSFSEVLPSLRPDILVLLGDRFELLSIAVAALISKIPIAHIHGGEKTEGAFDDAIRHSITKMSNIHFVATEKYKKRVIQLGENPSTVFNVGGLGVDNIRNVKLLKDSELEKKFKFKFSKKNILITFHPVTLESDSIIQFKVILSAIKQINSFESFLVIFTYPNADTSGRILIEEINNFCKEYKNTICIKSFGEQAYLSVLKKVDFVIGNSSSGLLEAPSFNTPTINVGNRQKGRIEAKSVISVSADKAEILKGINIIFSSSFKKRLRFNKNPYDNGNSSSKIIKILKKIEIKTTKKEFFDL